MQITSVTTWMAIIAGVTLYVVVSYRLTSSRPALRGLTIPLAFTLMAVYYFAKPMIISNPHPTMREGMLMTFYGTLAAIGYVVLGITRLSQRRAKARRQS